MSDKPLVRVNVRSFDEVRRALASLFKHVAGHVHDAADIVSGALARIRGGTGTDMSVTGGAGHVVKQNSLDGSFTTGTVDTANITAKAVTYASIQDVAANKLLGSIAGGTTEEIACTAAGRALIDDANAAAQRVTLGLEIGVNVQAYDADLSIYAGITPSANVQAILAAANYAAMRALLDLEAGTDFYSIAAADAAFQPKDADLTAIAALSSAADKLAYATGPQTWALTDLSAFGRSLIDDAAAGNARTTLGLVIGTDVQAYDADLTTWASLTPSANAQSLVIAANYAAMKALLDLEAGTDFPSQATFDDHSARHESGGGDPIKLDDFAAPDDNTDLDVSTTKHGLCPKLPNNATKYLDGTGAYSVPASSGSDVNAMCSSWM